MYQYGIIGFGGLGRKHLNNLLQIGAERKDIQLAAICGTTEEQARKTISINLGTVDVSQVDFSKCRFYADYHEMLDHEKLDFVFSVLPTDLHEDVALYALSKGIHVFSEKPMALTLEGCDRMVAAAQKSQKYLMVGQCLRFHPAYRKLKAFIDSGCYGRVRNACFERYSQTPLWTWNNWILDSKKSGGCVLDMHVHDVDLINWFFGVPDRLRSIVTDGKYLAESVDTTYWYPEFRVSAKADWSLPQTYPFTARCRVDFEEASVLIQNDAICVYTNEERTCETVDSEMCFVQEAEAFLSTVIDNVPCEATSALSVRDTVRIVMAEIQSSVQGNCVCRL